MAGRTLALLALFSSTFAASGVTNNPSSTNGQEFDYIVIGAGLGGTTVAARLSENPDYTVLLVEVGADNRDDSRVYDIYAYSQAFGSELDWAWDTDQGRVMHGGKTLGGSTSINGGHYTRGSAAQYDAISSLLEDADAGAGWDWDGIFSYMKKSEGFSGPNDQQRAKGAQSVDAYHGTSGPLQVTYPDEMYGGPQQIAFVDTITNLTGIIHAADINGGDGNAISITPFTINWHAGDHRSSSEEAYLTPVENDRTNWLTLTEHMVTKITWANPGNIPLTASGIEFAPANGSSTRYTAKARKEVIVSAGAIQTPALLQLSGIGDSNLLGPLGITTLLDLKTVGKNLQEQTMNNLGANGNFDYGGRGPPDAIAYPSLYQVFGNNASDAVKKIQSNLQTWAASQADSALDADALEQIYHIQSGLIIDQNAPIVELFYDTGFPDDIGIDMWQLLPFSRGSVSIQTNDPFVKPAVKVNYFSVDWDLDVQIASARLSREIITGSPLSELSTGETIPGSEVPDNDQRGSDDSWRSWITEGFSSVAHPVGTAAMMKRSLGGVVDAQLKVYDTSNVRVVDASVLPLQISAHLSAPLYGIAEKAADIIKAAQ
ncbi:alcohol oxidase [Dendrothele bispora CBS 962.96]|uniref:Alcohol oxidase n=1 Tax=Dendrothele bispora (strain CBS 962.96) TaxID=1314807 RepID=A0A4S8KPQ8_DENBC|nr:alcohol oxidase [Dendrothele bispora CBS 962.96]